MYLYLPSILYVANLIKLYHDFNKGYVGYMVAQRNAHWKPFWELILM